MSTMVDPYTLRSAWVACVAAIKKNDRENRKRGYEVQIEEPIQLKFQRTRGTIKRNDQISIKLGVLEAPNKMQEE